MAAIFELFEKDSNKFYFRLKSAHGISLLHSDAHTDKDQCRLAIDRVKINAQFAHRFEIVSSDIGRFYYLLRSGNGQILGMSELYAQKEECERLIEMMKTEAPAAEITEG
jgi:uncharacterized protein